MPVGQKLWWYSKQVKFCPPSGLGVFFLGEQEEWRLVSKSQTRRVCQKHSLKVWKGGKLKRRKGKTSKNHHLKKQQIAEFLWIMVERQQDTFKRDPFESPSFTTHPQASLPIPKLHSQASLPIPKLHYPSPSPFGCQFLFLSSSSKWSSLAPSSTSGEPGMAAFLALHGQEKIIQQSEKEWGLRGWDELNDCHYTFQYFFPKTQKLPDCDLEWNLICNIPVHKRKPGMSRLIRHHLVIR